MAMNPKGTIRKDSITHRIYEAVLTHPDQRFTTKDIYETLHKDYPDIKLDTVSSLLTNRKSLIRELIQSHDTASRPFTFVRKIDPPIRPIYDPASKGTQKFKSNKPVLPNAEKTEETAPDTHLSAEQIGEAMMALVDKLKKEITCLHIKLQDMNIEMKSRDDTWRSTLNQKDRTIQNLNDKIIILNRTVQKSSKTFPLSELTTIKNGR